MESEVRVSAEDIRDLLKEGDVDGALSMLSSLHPADQAEMVAGLDSRLRSRVVSALPRDRLAELLGYLPDDDRRRVGAELVPAVLGPLLDLVEPDVAADVLHALPTDQVPRVLQTMRSGPSVASLLPVCSGRRPPADGRGQPPPARHLPA
jgi:Mg/Co/Ni transporter MgtE